MGRLFVTGDIHGGLDIDKLTSKNFKCSDLTKDDILVILGDVGLTWCNGPIEKYYLDWLDKKPWTTFCVLGNHENYDLIAKLPTTTFGGEEVYQADNSIFYAKTGRIYTLCGQKCLVVNGADSTDVFIDGKRYRKEGVSWWPQERITKSDVTKALVSLKQCGGTVDYVFTHTGGSAVSGFLGFNPTPSDTNLDTILERVIYKDRFCGHYHRDMTTPDAKIMYNNIRMIAYEGKETVF